MSQKIVAEKIFIDADEEIVFIIDKLIESSSNRILLIIPKHAALTSSLVNLKLLARKVADLNKQIVLITSSDLAQLKSKETLLLAFEKVENVGEQTWEEAQILIEKLVAQREELKQKLIAERKEQPPREEETKEDESFEEENIPYTNIESENEELEKEIASPVSTRMEPKIIELGSFKLVSGGDIKHHKHIHFKSESFSKDTSITPFSSNDNNKKKVSNTRTVIGKDIGFKNHLEGNDRHFQTELAQKRIKSIPESTKKKLSRIAIIVSIIISLYVVVSAKMITTKISIKPASNELVIKEQVIAAPNSEELDIENKIIPIKQITVSDSGSSSGIATQKTNTGKYASGVVDITNKTENDITLSAGTIIRTTVGSLDFELTESITVPARLSDITFSTFENAPIRAKNFGEEYNVSSVDVVIGNYKTSTELSGRIYKRVQGGTIEEITVVSENDVEKLKKEIIDTLKVKLERQIEQQLSEDSIKIVGSEKVEEKNLELSKQIGEEASSFDIVNLEIEYSISYVSQSDIDLVADELVLEETGKNPNVEFENSSSALVNNFSTQEDGRVVFDIEKHINTFSVINDQDIATEIIGKSSKDAESVLVQRDDIEEVNVEISPFFAPNFLKKVPDDLSKIDVAINN